MFGLSLQSFHQALPFHNFPAANFMSDMELQEQALPEAPPPAYKPEETDPRQHVQGPRAVPRTAISEFSVASFSFSKSSELMGNSIERL